MILARLRLWFYAFKIKRRLRCPTCGGKQLKVYDIWYNPEHPEIRFVPVHCQSCNTSWNHVVESSM